MYLKIAAALALVAASIAVGWKVTTWYQQASLVPALTIKVSDVTAERDAMRKQIALMNAATADANKEIEQWRQRGSDLAASVLAAQGRAVTEATLRMSAERKLREVPPPKDCGGAMRWLVEHAPRGWEK